MKQKAVFIGAGLMILLFLKVYPQQENFPILKGPYLGQKLPGEKPEIFASGIVSTMQHEHSRIEFSKDGTEIYWTVIPVDTNSRTKRGRPFRLDLQSIRFSKNYSGKWSPPQALQIIKDKDARSPVLSPDEKSLYFFSSGPNGDPMKNSKSDLYGASRKDSVWADPVKVTGLIPQEEGKGIMSFCFARNGNLYFDYGEAGATGEFVWDIYFSEYQNGAYEPPVKLEYGINDGKSDWCPWIAPDESYLIWSSHREGEAGNGDLYISFRQANGPWGRPVNMGIEVNTSGQERFPSVSPDGKFLFFARHKDMITYSDIYWMRASVIETLREKVGAIEKRDRAEAGHSLSQPNDFPKLTGPYLGQKPPGMIPEMFAPGIVSTDNGAGCYGFLNNGQMFVFERCAAGEDWKYQPVQVMEEKHGLWTEPRPETFGGLYPYNFTVGPDGQTLYFSSLRLPDGSGPHRWANVWKVQRTPGGWSRPVMFEAPVNTDGPDAYPTVTKDGTLYFMSVRAGGSGQDDIYRAEMKRGEYPAVENIGPPVNSEHAEVDPFVAADESCLIFCSDRPGGYGKFDLYVSFLGPDGRWSEPANMGQEINTSGQEFRPGLSADGRYFFFTRYEENSDTDGLYWVSSKVMDGLRQSASKRRQERGSK